MKALAGLFVLFCWFCYVVVLPCAIVGIAIHFIRKFW
jgi:hypothetical protein